jgi:branched-chain amino acid transport system substrate-binding protein
MFQAASKRHLTVLSAVAGTALLLTLALAGTASSARSSSAANAAASPIKIGVILPYTGAFGLYGKPMEAALTARLARNHNRAGGHPIELVFEDEATDAKTAVLKATKLITQDKVQAVVCCVNGASTLAVGPILAQRKVPQIGPIPNPSGLEKYRTAVLAAPTAGHDAELLGRYVARKMKDKTAAIVASDFSYGHEVAEAFERGFEAFGGKVTKAMYPSVGNQDYGPYLTQIGNADVVFAGVAGADAISFLKQTKRFGIKQPIVGHGPLVTELLLGPEGQAAEGVTAAFYYSSGIDTAANKGFIAYMKAKNPSFVPSHFTAGAWNVGSVLISGINRMKGNVNDGEKFAAAIRRLKVQAPWGPLTFNRKTGEVRTATYIYTVVDGDGGLPAHKILQKISG